MSNGFSLKDLKTGMKLTMSDPWYSNCPEYIVLLNTDDGDVLVNTEANSWSRLSGIKIYGNILKVEVPDCPFNIKGVTPKWKTIWERQVKSEQDIEKENLQKVIDKLQQDLHNAQQQLENLGGI